MEKSVLLIGVGWLGKQILQTFSRNGIFVGACSRSEEKLCQMIPLMAKYLVTIEETSFKLSAIGSETPQISSYSHCVICLPPYAALKHHIKDILHQLQPNATVIFCSSIGIYHPAKTINELSLLKKDHLLFEQELEVKKHRHVILRLGGLVGSERHPIYSLVKNKRQIYKGDTVNLIHAKDICSIILKLVRQEVFNKIYNVVYPNHMRKGEYYEQSANALLGTFIETLDGGQEKIVDGHRVVDDLGMNYQYPIDNWNSFSENNN